jgi:hypothetical protein
MEEEQERLKKKLLDELSTVERKQDEAARQVIAKWKGGAYTQEQLQRMFYKVCVLYTISCDLDFIG